MNALRQLQEPDAPTQNALAAYPRPTDDELWMAGMREQNALHSKYAKPGPYATALSPQDEVAFRQWVSANRVPFNPNDQVSDYDMRGYWRDVAASGGSQTRVNPNDHQMHFPDTYKTPHHRSFSAESRYATDGAPSWVNDHQLALPDGKIVFDERARR